MNNDDIYLTEEAFQKMKKKLEDFGKKDYWKGIAWVGNINNDDPEPMELGDQDFWKVPEFVDEPHMAYPVMDKITLPGPMIGIHGYGDWPGPTLHAPLIRRLMCGSRGASKYLIGLAVELAGKYVNQGDYIIVGDAEGIDRAIIKACNNVKYKLIEVHGAKGYLKCKSLYGKNFTHKCSYPARDGIMSGRADTCDAFWDGKSPGTKLTADMCKSLGLELKWHTENQKDPT